MWILTLPYKHLVGCATVQKWHQCGKNCSPGRPTAVFERESFKYLQNLQGMSGSFFIRWTFQHLMFWLHTCNICEKCTSIPALLITYSFGGISTGKLRASPFGFAPYSPWQTGTANTPLQKASLTRLSISHSVSSLVNRSQDTWTPLPEAAFLH